MLKVSTRGGCGACAPQKKKTGGNHDAQKGLSSVCQGGVRLQRHFVLHHVNTLLIHQRFSLQFPLVALKRKLLRMKVLLLLMVSCIALHNGQGAPATYVYKFLRCNPDGNQANCVTQQTPVRPWREDLPDKLPSASAQYLEAVPVEESPQPEEGSAGYEGSASGWPFIADRAFEAAESGTGSGESSTKSDMDLYSGGDMKVMRWLRTSRSVVGGAKPAEQEMKDDHLLQL